MRIWRYLLLRRQTLADSCERMCAAAAIVHPWTRRRLIGAGGSGLSPAQRVALHAAAYLLLPLAALSGCAAISSGLGAHGSPPTVAPAPTISPKFQFVDGGAPPTPPLAYTAIRFAPGVSFTQALRLVTDLGFQPVAWCLGAEQAAGGWRSPDEAPGFDPRAGGTLGVFTTSESPLDWPTRLMRLPQVTAAVNGGTPCALIPVLPPDPSIGSFLGPAGVFTPVQVQFAATVSYDQALASVMALGFRLGDPCPLPPTASSTDPVGQETAFAITHALYVNTTFANATGWRYQLTRTAGVLSERDGTAALCS